MRRYSKMFNEKEVEWGKLGFAYIKADYNYISYYKDGKWDEGKLIQDNTLTISNGSTALHYGQQCFEGLKAYRTKDGSVQLFRPDQNAKRMIKSCNRIIMPEFPVERFVDACIQVVKANERFIPPYGSGATLYLRPFMIGVGDNVGHAAHLGGAIFGLIIIIISAPSVVFQHAIYLGIMGLPLAYMGYKLLAK